MAGLTARFKLSRFGGGTRGTITDDGQKYTSADRDTIDRLLAQAELHDHQYRPAAASLLAPATAVLEAGAGVLQAGQTYRYRYAVVDEAGMETIASPVVTVATPDLLPAPGLPNLSVDPEDSGALPVGIYFYALTALRGTEESPLGPAATVATVAGEGAVTVELPDLGDADSFRVWRMGMSEAGFTKLGITSAATFVDAGTVPADPCACDPGNQPPMTNTGVAVYGVTVTLPVSVDLTHARSWRLYRSWYSGFPTSALVHEVVEREEEWEEDAPLLREWTDTGGELLSGTPSDSDQNMRFQPFAFDHADELPAVTPYPEYYPMVAAGVLYAKIGGAWTPIGRGGSGGSSVLTAPDGSRFTLVVGADGALSTEPTVMPGPPTAPQNVSVS